MTWFAFQSLNGGNAIDLAGTQEKQAVAEGFHGYATQAQAKAKPNSVNVITKALADTWIADYNAAVKEEAQPGGANANILNPATAVKAGATGLVNSIPGLAQIGDFFGALSEKNTWIRVAKVIVGSVMIIVGLSKLTGAGDAVGGAAKTAARLGAW
jgi:hypothetical protein